VNHFQAVSSHATERYLLDEMAELERHAFERHYFDCAECAEDLRQASLMREGVRAGLAGGPSSSVRRDWRPSVVLPWAAAAVLVVALGYQSLGTRPPAGGFGGDGAIQPLVAVTLRPASRGAIPTIEPGRAIALAVDVSVPAGTVELAYELRDGDGRVVAAGRAAAPDLGSPLILALQPSTFEAPGSYSLGIRDAAPDGRDLGAYRFTVRGP
jgi:hypothetical protein